MRPLFVAALAGVLSGCSATVEECTPGSPGACTCADSSKGTRVCDTEGAFGACSCPGAAATGSGGAGGTVSTSSASTGGGRCTSGACAGCAGQGDPLWNEVVAFIPCTTSIDDVSGRSEVVPGLRPTNSSLPAGAPGGASCTLGNDGAFGSAHGFKVKIPTALRMGDFTIEFAIYQTAIFDPTDMQSEILISTVYPPAGGAVAFPTFFSGAGYSAVTFAGAGNQLFSDRGSTTERWEQYAASRVAGRTHVFRDGVALTTVPDSEDYTDTTFYVGEQLNGTYNAVMGSMAQIRVTRAGRYTGSYAACSTGFSSGR